MGTVLRANGGGQELRHPVCSPRVRGRPGVAGYLRGTLRGPLAGSSCSGLPVTDHATAAVPRASRPRSRPRGFLRISDSERRPRHDGAAAAGSRACQYVRSYDLILPGSCTDICLPVAS